MNAFIFEYQVYKCKYIKISCTSGKYHICLSLYEVVCMSTWMSVGWFEHSCHVPILDVVIIIYMHTYICVCIFVHVCVCMHWLVYVWMVGWIEADVDKHENFIICI